MSIYTPDKWVVIAITNPDSSTLHKIFATWRGGYTTGDSWQMNSGNKSVTKDIYWYHVHGYSGSIYELHKKGYGLSGYSSGVLQQMLDHPDAICVKLLSEEESLEYLEKMSNEHIPN